MSVVLISARLVIPQRMSEWERGLAAIAQRATEENDAQVWSCGQVIAGEINRFHLRSERADWAETGTAEDFYAAVRRVYGEEEGTALLDRLRGCFSTAHTTLLRERLDLSSATQSTRGFPPLAAITRCRPRPGGAEAYEELLRAVAEAVPKTGDSRDFVAYEPEFGVRGEYWVIRRLRGLGELDTSAPTDALLAEAFGASESARLLRRCGDATQACDTELVALRPDMSKLR